MDLSIVLPARNESQTLAGVIREIASSFCDSGIEYEIIVVDDQSIDSTNEVLRVLQREIPQLFSLKTKEAKGYGNAVLTGLRISRGEVISFIDADSQVSGSYLKKMYQLMKEGGTDFCKAKRIKRDDGRGRLLLSNIYNLFFNIYFSVKANDINAKPKMMTRRFFEESKFQSESWFLDGEIVLKAYSGGYRLSEVEIEFLKRKRGKSKVNLSSLGKSLKEMLFKPWKKSFIKSLRS